jgi:hypothetical protein
MLWGEESDMRKLRPVCRYGVVLLCLTLSSCVFISTKVTPLTEETLQASPTFVTQAPTKAHLSDGSVVTFAQGFEMRDETLRGQGIQYDLVRQTRTMVDEVPLESVANLEYYHKKLHAVPLIVSSIPPLLVGSVVLLKSLYGSCPTVYSFDGHTYALEAETFSHSVAKRFEGEDLDRLDLGKVVNGDYTLQVTNEALETHYINTMSLLTVDHPVGYEAFPTVKRDIVLVGKPRPILTATSKLGHEVTALVASRDQQWYQSDPRVVQELTQTVTQDWIDVKVNIPPDAQKMYVALRGRNTLMSSVLFYDVMLRAQGIHALEWQGATTAHPLYAWRLHQWFNRHFGLYLQVFDGKRFQQALRIPPTGPIAWHQVAAALPVPAGDTAHLRFAFLPDNWAIDWIGVSFAGTTDYRTRSVTARELIDSHGNRNAELKARLRANDARYLITYPGESYLLKFTVGPVPAGRQHSYFVTSSGFYIEWLRQEWLRHRPTASTAGRFALNDATILQTAKLWLAKKQRFEKAFFESRIIRPEGTTP